MGWKGYNIKDWLKGNWNTVLELAKTGLPLLLGLAVFTTHPWLIALVTALGKFVLDAFHYWVNN